MVHFDKFLDQREANAKPTLRPNKCALYLSEHIKNLRKHFGRNACSIVGDSNDGISAFNDRRKHNAPTIRSIFRRIIQQVADHLSQTYEVTMYPYWFLGEVCNQLVPS